ncbi:GNAT family N-acetyltransferase, partial [Nocardia sp. NPDC058497]|uniref:GNAT family N-acetyltransferase n=1 Tax=Nocardia sp. NPDC058497 TaxID=3346529 RepID=UPI0036462A82
MTLDGLDQLPAHTRRCVFWELDPAVAADSHAFSDPVFEKEAWLSTVMLEWGSCGQLAHVDNNIAGCALYSPPSAVPRSTLFPTSPVSPDAVLLTTLQAEFPYEEADVAHRLIQGVVADLVRRGVRAIEAFGIRNGPASSSLADRGLGSSMRLMERIAAPRRDTAAAAHRTPRNSKIHADLQNHVGLYLVGPQNPVPPRRQG